MHKNHKIFVVIIPACACSREIKKRNIIQINGHPLASYLIEVAKNSKFIK